MFTVDLWMSRRHSSSEIDILPHNFGRKVVYHKTSTGSRVIKKMKNITVTVDNGLRVIIFDRPEKKNALSKEMYHDMILALKEAAADENTIITAITGRGDYYTSGNDISDPAKFSGGDIKEVVNEASTLVRNFVSAFIEFPKILVAVVNGPAIGIGVTTLALCDIVYASDKATFNTPFVPLGISAEGCSTYTFPRIMGTSKAGDLLYFNYKLAANEANDCGLVSKVFPDSTFREEVLGHLKKMVTLPIKSMMYTKALVRRWNLDDLRQANEAECERLKERWMSEDNINAMLRFISRRSKM